MQKTDIGGDGIPVFIDKIERQENQCLLRFYYFVMSLHTKKKTALCQQALLTEGGDLKRLTPAINWYGSTEQFFLRASLAGKPFECAGDVDELFDFIDGAGLELQAEYHTVLLSSSKSMEILMTQEEGSGRGAVYRIHLDSLLDSVRSGRDFFLSPEKMAFSPEETRAFAEWNQQVIRTVKERYHKQPEKTLAGRRGHQ